MAIHGYAGNGQMPRWSPSISCPFMRRLIVVLSEEIPASSSRQDTFLFNRLLELEMSAEREGATVDACRVIGRVRRIVGVAACKEYPPTIRGH